MKLTKKDKCLVMLKAAGPRGVRSDKFLDENIGRGPAEVGKLIKEGHPIVPEPLPEDRPYTRYVYKGDVGSSAGCPSASTAGESQTASAASSGTLFELEKPKPKPLYIDVWDDGKAA